MNMLGFLKSGAALAVTWDDAYVWPEVAKHARPRGRIESRWQRITTALVAATLGPHDPPDAVGQGRLEHAGRRLPADRRAEGLGRHAARQDPPRPARRAAGGRGEREALDVPGAADERGEHEGRIGQGPLDVRRGGAGRRAPSQGRRHLPLPVHHRRLDRRRLRLPPSRQSAGQSRVRRQRGPGRRDPADPGPGLRRLPARQLPGHVPRREELEPGLHREEARRLADPGRAVAGRPGVHGLRPQAARTGDAAAEPAGHPASCSPRGATSSTRPMPSARASAPTPTTRSAATTTSPGRSSSATRPGSCSACSAASAGGNGPCRTATSSRAWWASPASISTTSSRRASGPR